MEHSKKQNGSYALNAPRVIVHWKPVLWRILIPTGDRSVKSIQDGKQFRHLQSHHQIRQQPLYGWAWSPCSGKDHLRYRSKAVDKKTYYMRRVLNLGKGKCYLLLLSKGMSYVLTKKNAANSSRYRCLEFQLLRIEIWTRLPGSVSCMVSSSEVYVDLHWLLLLAQEQTFRRCQHCF